MARKKQRLEAGAAYGNRHGGKNVFGKSEGAGKAKVKEGAGKCRTPAVIPGAAPPRPRLGRGRRIYFKMMTNHVTTTIEGDEAERGVGIASWTFGR